MASLATWVAALADIKAAGIARAMIRIFNNDAYYHLGNIENPTGTLTAISGTDTYLQKYGIGWLAEIKLPSMQASYTEISALNDFALAQEVHVRLTLPDDQVIDSYKLTACPTMGLQWKLNCGGNFDGFRKIEYDLKCAYGIGELDTILVATDATATDIGSPNQDDAPLSKGWAQVATVANQKPNGIQKIEVKLEDDVSWVNLGDFSDGQLTIETVPGTIGGGGRQKPRTITLKVAGSASLSETSNTKLKLHDSILSSQGSVRYTFMDGLILTLNAGGAAHTSLIVGLNFSGNTDKGRYGTLEVNGTIPIYTGTNWTGLWTAP
jgi:hypothetical protein